MTEIPKSATGQATKLDTLRAQIDAVDSVVIASLSKRIKLVRSVGKFKRVHNITVFAPKRRDALKKMWATRGKSLGVPPRLIQEMFELIHKHSVALEKKTK